MTWNILTGGQDDEGRQRLDRAVEVVNAQDPDVLLLQEATGFDAQGQRLLYKVENDLDRRGFLAVADTGFNIVAFVRRDQRVLRYQVFNRDFFHVLLSLRLVLEDNRLLHVLGVHLCPHSPVMRLLEAQHLARFARVGELVVMAGDFNAPDPSVEHSEAFMQMPGGHRARYVSVGENCVPDTRAGLTIEAAGFVDVGRKHGNTGFTFPTNLPIAGPAFGPLRLDYVYATEPLASAASSYEVLRNPVTDQVSDHYPIVVDFHLKPERQQVAP